MIPIALAVCLALGWTQAAPSDTRTREEAVKWLSGPLSNIPEETKLRLVRLAHETPGGVRALTNETFRGKLYLEVLLNSSQEEEHPAGVPPAAVDRMKAVGELAHSRLIPALFKYAETLGEVRGIHGIKLLLIELPANSFIQLYAPLNLINGARAGKVTLQALLDGSVMYVNTEIMRVRLPSP
jgi:hypothetical protein